MWLCPDDFFIFLILGGMDSFLWHTTFILVIVPLCRGLAGSADLEEGAAAVWLGKYQITRTSPLTLLCDTAHHTEDPSALTTTETYQLTLKSCQKWCTNHLITHNLCHVCTCLNSVSVCLRDCKRQSSACPRWWYPDRLSWAWESCPWRAGCLTCHVLCGTPPCATWPSQVSCCTSQPTVFLMLFECVTRTALVLHPKAVGCQCAKCSNTKDKNTVVETFHTNLPNQSQVLWILQEMIH